CRNFAVEIGCKTSSADVTGYCFPFGYVRFYSAETAPLPYFDQFVDPRHPGDFLNMRVIIVRSQFGWKAESVLGHNQLNSGMYGKKDIFLRLLLYEGQVLFPIENFHFAEVEIHKVGDALSGVATDHQPVFRSLEPFWFLHLFYMYEFVFRKGDNIASCSEFRKLKFVRVSAYAPFF